MTKNIITMTSKGTFTLPAFIRKDMELSGAGEQLVISYNPETKQATIYRAQEFEALHRKLLKFTKGKKPLTDPHAFYADSKMADYEKDK